MEDDSRVIEMDDLRKALERCFGYPGDNVTIPLVVHGSGNMEVMICNECGSIVLSMPIRVQRDQELPVVNPWHEPVVAHVVSLHSDLLSPSEDD